jgi:hypothetical protein
VVNKNNLVWIKSQEKRITKTGGGRERRMKGRRGKGGISMILRRTTTSRELPWTYRPAPKESKPNPKRIKV